MSLKYEILKRLVKAMGFKKKFAAASTEELLEMKRKRNRKTKIPVLKDKDIDIIRTDVMGFPVLKMIHKKPVDRANLFIIGTGMTSMPDKGAVKNALKLSKKTGLDFYVPYYPLCTEYPITKTYEMIYETYKAMLESYDREHVSVLGYSSGGNLALGMVSHINFLHKDTPMPHQIIAVSPGSTQETDEEWERLLELDKKDVVTPASFMKMAGEIMRHGEKNIPDYMLYLKKGNYEGCPKVTLFYGTDETLYAFLPGIEDGLKRYGAEYRTVIGEGLYHCYPVLAFCREAKEGQKILLDILREK